MIDSGERESGGLYVHLPFCPYLCPYCDFAKWSFDDIGAGRYLRALEAQIAVQPPFAATTLYLGGGTPNTYHGDAITGVVRRVRERFELPSDAEATIEVNPDVALCGDFARYRAAGLNRLSIGVQSFVGQELRVLGRRHSPEDVGLVVHRARDDGFVNVSVDLMFGVPGQTVASFERSLEAALDLNVEHVSTYGLTVEAGTPYERWYARAPGAFPDGDVQAEMYALAIERLSRAGFEQYEISNFARPGYRSAHNLNYWKNGSYLGLGVGAASYLGGERRTTTRDRAIYEAAALRADAIPADAERLEGAARLGEATMLALRTAEGVDFQSFAERYHVVFNTMFRSELDRLTAAGLMDVSLTHAALTPRGRALANEVCAAFLPGE